jgi:cytochrome b pre-mRNA-processing protein 3
MRSAQEGLATADLDGIMNREQLFPAFSIQEAVHGA